MIFLFFKTSVYKKLVLYRNLCSYQKMSVNRFNSLSVEDETDVQVKPPTTQSVAQVEPPRTSSGFEFPLTFLSSSDTFSDYTRVDEIGMKLFGTKMVFILNLFRFLGDTLTFAMLSLSIHELQKAYSVTSDSEWTEEKCTQLVNAFDDYMNFVKQTLLHDITQILSSTPQLANTIIDSLQRFANINKILTDNINGIKVKTQANKKMSEEIARNVIRAQNLINSFFPSTITTTAPVPPTSLATTTVPVTSFAASPQEFPQLVQSNGAPKHPTWPKTVSAPVSASSISPILGSWGDEECEQTENPSQSTVTTTRSQTVVTEVEINLSAQRNRIFLPLSQSDQFLFNGDSRKIVHNQQEKTIAGIQTVPFNPDKSYTKLMFDGNCYGYIQETKGEKGFSAYRTTFVARKRVEEIDARYGQSAIFTTTFVVSACKQTAFSYAKIVDSMVHSLTFM